MFLCGLCICFFSISVFALSGVQTEEYDFLHGMVMSPWHHIHAHHFVLFPVFLFSSFPVFLFSCFPVFLFSYLFVFCCCHLYSDKEVAFQSDGGYLQAEHSSVFSVQFAGCTLFSVLLHSLPCTIHCTLYYGRKHSKTQEGTE